VAKGLHNLCKELTLNQAYRERGIYNMGLVQQILTHPPRTQDVDILFELAQMELWLTGLQHQHQKASG
jgi:hypothetical protein